MERSYIETVRNVIFFKVISINIKILKSNKTGIFSHVIILKINIFKSKLTSKSVGAT